MASRAKGVDHPVHLWDWEQGFWRRGLPVSVVPPIRKSKKQERVEENPEQEMSDMSAATPEQSTPNHLPVVPSGNAIGAHGGFAIPGMERFTAKELSVADLKIGQGTSRDEGVTAGKFYNKLDPKEQWESLILVALTYGHGRVLFPKTEEGKPDYDAAIPCRSDDGLVPAPSIEKPIAQKCVTDIRGEELCPMAKWGKDRKKPMCAETATLVVIVAETGVPFRFSVKGADVATMRKFLSNVAHKALGSTAPVSLFDFTFRLGTIKEKNDQGTWFAPTFTSLTAVEKPGAFKRYHDLFAAAVVAPEPEKPAAETSAPTNDSATPGETGASPTAPAEPPKTTPKGKPKF